MVPQTLGYSRRMSWWDKLRVTLTSLHCCVKQTASGELLCNRELSSALCDDLERRAGGSSRGRDMCSHIPGDLVVKNPPANAGDTGSVPGSGRSPKEGNGNPFQYSCLGNLMNRGARQAAVHVVAKCLTQLSS